MEPLEDRRLLALLAVSDVFTGLVEDSQGDILEVLRNDRASDGAALSLQHASQPNQGGSVRIDEVGRLVYRPAPDFTGVEGFTYRVTDGIDEADAAVTVLVKPVNDAPRLTGSALQLTKGWVFPGQAAGSGLGYSVARAGDVDGNGVEDQIIGAPLDDANGEDSGSVYVLSGSDGSLLYTWHGDGPHDEFGWSVSGAGDVNADGLADVIVGRTRTTLAATRAAACMCFRAPTGRDCTRRTASLTGSLARRSAVWMT